MTLNGDISRNVKRDNDILLLAHNFHDIRPYYIRPILMNLCVTYLRLSQCFLTIYILPIGTYEKRFCINFRIFLSSLEVRSVEFI